MHKTDCVVVGAGPAGSACALALARKGIETVLIERGSNPGEKNVASFVLFTDVLKDLIPDFIKKGAPVERTATNTSFAGLYGRDFMEFKMRFDEHHKNPIAYTAYRGSFDRWLAEQAEKEGVILARGKLVTGLLKKNGRVCGIRAGDEELEADVVVGADGIHSVVSRDSGLYKDDTSRYMLGVKEVIELKPEVIEQRFNLQKNEGTVIDGIWSRECFLFWLYTNNDTVSTGLFCPIDTLKQGVNLREHLEELKKHPYIESKIQGGKLREYSAHIIPDGGRIKMKRLYGDGVLLCGAAGGFMNIAWLGVNTCMLSGLKAAETVVRAKKAGNYDAKALSCYKVILYQTGLPRMMYDARKMSNFLVKSGRKKVLTYPANVYKYVREAEQDQTDYRNPDPYPLMSEAYENLVQEFLPRLIRTPGKYLVRGIEKISYGLKKIKIRRKV